MNFRMSRILNIITDQKFIDSVIERHDALDTFSEHVYVLIGEKKHFTYIKNINRINVVKKRNFLKFLENGNFTGVLLHNLYSLPLDLIPKIPTKIKVFWMAWGFDIYTCPLVNSPCVKIDLYHQHTLDFIRGGKNYISNIRTLIKNIFQSFLQKRYYNAVKRVDYMSGVLPIEYDLLKKAHPDIKLLPFNYSYSRLFVLNNKSNVFLSNQGSSILIGNSADITNNHLDVFELLKTINLENRKVIVPLSYSGTKAYINEVKFQGSRIFNSEFIPLDNYLPLEEYRKILSSCGFCIFFHERQQALDNINLMLRLGSKVFLSETSVVYKYYISLGIHVYSIQSELNFDNLNSTIPQNFVKENILILNSLRNIGSETEKLKVLAELSDS